MWKILKFLPRNWISRLTGFLVHRRLPSFLNLTVIRLFASAYTIDLTEAENEVRHYPSLGDFFVRRLKPGSRPVGLGPAVHPADSRILQSGPIVDGRCVQAKGLSYSVREFLVDEGWQHKFDGGFFITYYLCPTDYHRVHSPVAGLIRKTTYVPGDLWPVHDAAVGSIENLYLVNERAAIEIATDFGPVAVVFVGATNVGSIELAFDETITGNRGRAFTERVYQPPKPIDKGQELGMFRMGSTVVVLYSKEFRAHYGQEMDLGPRVKVNSALLHTATAPGASPHA